MSTGFVNIDYFIIKECYRASLKIALMQENKKS